MQFVDDGPRLLLDLFVGQLTHIIKGAGMPSSGHPFAEQGEDLGVAIMDERRLWNTLLDG
jgi:hypothetical protein